MYETEANSKKESRDQVPAEVLATFGELKGCLVARTTLPWSEHCTECVWPSCYSTCDLYSPREDGKCRRFVNGMVRVECPESVNSYLLKITFKRWAKLWTPGNILLSPLDSALRREVWDYRIGSVLHQLPVPSPLRSFTTRKRYSLKKRIANRRASSGSLPDSFLVECFNPGDNAVALSLTMRSVTDRVSIPFQRLFTLGPGIHRIRVSCKEIAGVLDLTSPFTIELSPNDDGGEVTLLFGLMDFVQEGIGKKHKREIEPANPSRKVKCVVWDLDNTMWDGVLVERESESLELKPGMREILQELDRRGILLSIASKNNHDEAISVLRRMGIEDLFLVPQISWEPKSEAMRKISNQLNLGLDSLLFVDDSDFELEQVASSVPGIRAMNAQRYREIPDLEECTVPVTAESQERRKMYQVEAGRQDLASSFAGDYLAFLKHCDIHLNIGPMTAENLERVHELTQRTNQMNFSGNRYDREVLRQLLATPWLDTYVLDVNDRFGTYGIVGFCIVDNREPLLTDLMFSCRIQSKRIEHGFLAWLIRRYVGDSGAAFWANYRKTDRNAPSGAVFADIGMHETANDKGVSRLIFPAGQSIPEDGIVKIVVQEVAPVA